MSENPRSNLAATGNWEATAPLVDSVKIAARRLGISRAKLYKEISAGRLRTVKAGKRRLVSRDAQAEWLAALPSR